MRTTRGAVRVTDYERNPSMVSNIDGGGGDHFSEWDELAKARAICAFKIKRVCGPEQFPNGEVEPVVADMAILAVDSTAPSAQDWVGLVLRDEKLIKAGLLQKLRTKREKIGKRFRQVERAKGEEVAVVIDFYTDKRNVQRVGARPCTDEEFETVTKVFDKYAGDPWSGMEREELVSAGMPVGVQNADAVGSADDVDLPF